MTAAETEPPIDPAQRPTTPSDARRSDRAHHLARVCEGLSTKVTDPERARRLARLLGADHDAHGRHS